MTDHFDRSRLGEGYQVYVQCVWVLWESKYDVVEGCLGTMIPNYGTPLVGGILLRRFFLEPFFHFHALLDFTKLGLNHKLN